MKKIKIMDLPYNNWIFAAKLHLTLYLLCCVLYMRMNAPNADDAGGVNIHIYVN